MLCFFKKISNMNFVFKFQMIKAMQNENQTEDQLIKELQSDVKQEKLHTMIIKNTPKALGIFALILILVAAKLYWDSKKNQEHQADNDKLMHAIELYQENKITEANNILDELAQNNNSTGDIASFVKNHRLEQFTEQDIEKLKKSQNQLIKELVEINLNEVPGNYKILHLLAKEKEIIHDINMKKYDDALKKIEDNFTNVTVLPSIEQRIDSYKKLIQVRKKK